MYKNNSNEHPLMII